MRSVNIADLKNRLSRYLGEVREGAELVVRDRNTPIAMIVPLSTMHAFDAEEVGLIAAGQLRPPQGRLPSSFWSMPAARVPLKRALAALSADRADRIDRRED